MICVKLSRADDKKSIFSDDEMKKRHLFEALFFFTLIQSSLSGQACIAIRTYLH